MSSTRDQVLEGLWPELDPADALNSLNQTVYFLRRVIEQEYVDDLSPGYGPSRFGLDMARRGAGGEPKQSLSNADEVVPANAISRPGGRSLAAVYRGRYALDFEYEESAAPIATGSTPQP